MAQHLSPPDDDRVVTLIVLSFHQLDGRTAFITERALFHMYNYSAYGMRLESELEFPELEGTQDAPVCDPLPVSIRLGDVPNELSGSSLTVEGYEVTPDHALLTMNSMTRFLISEAHSITVAPEADHEPAWMRIVLLSGALGILLHQRGLFPLHASAIVDGEQSIAFAGTSGAGKSTLVAGLSRTGLRILAEDKLLVRKDNGAWMAWPGIPFLHLFAESAQQGDLADTTRMTSSPRQGKSIHLDGARFRHEPAPLKALYMLDWSPDGHDPSITPLSTMEAFLELRTHASLHGLIPALGREAAFMQWATRLLSDVPVFRYQRSKDFGLFDVGLSQLRTHWSKL